MVDEHTPEEKQDEGFILCEHCNSEIPMKKLREVWGKALWQTGVFSRSNHNPRNLTSDDARAMVNKRWSAYRERQAEKEFAYTPGKTGRVMEHEIYNMREQGYTPNQIAFSLDVPIDQVELIIARLAKRSEDTTTRNRAMLEMARSGKTIREIAKEYAMSSARAGFIVKREASLDQPSDVGKRNIVTDKSLQEARLAVVRQMLDAGKTRQEIADALWISRSHVARLARQAVTDSAPEVKVTD